MLPRRRLWQTALRTRPDEREVRWIAAPLSTGDTFERVLAAQPCYLVPDRLLEDTRIDADLDRFFDSADVAARADACAPAFRERGYAALARAIHPFHLGALRIYTRRLLRTGAMKLGDSGDPRRYVSHNEPVARRFHERLTHVVERVTGVPIKPSYVYIAAYQSGAELRVHTDRAQCEYSISLLVDFTPEPLGTSPWPLLLDVGEGIVTIRQCLGDALVYRGRCIPHRREKLPSGMTSTSILFHYVDADFRGSLD